MNPVWQIKKEVLWSKIDDEIVLMSIEAGHYFTLDPVGSRIWSILSEKPASLDELVLWLMEDYEIDKETCMKDVQEFIDDMALKKLIIPVEQENPPEK